MSRNEPRHDAFATGREAGVQVTVPVFPVPPASNTVHPPVPKTNVFEISITISPFDA